MSTRRSFFKSLAKAAAIVALAPQLAFRVRPSKFEPLRGLEMTMTILEETNRFSACYTDEYIEALRNPEKSSFFKKFTVVTK